MPHSTLVSSTVDERLVADVARDLGADGLAFTDRQLWYAVCARMEGPQLTEGLAQIVGGVILILFGLVVGVLGTVFVAIVIPVGMVVLGMGLQNRRRERNRPTTRPLVIAYDDFVRDPLARLRDNGRAPAGLLPGDGLPGVEPPQPETLAAATHLLVCDHGETAALLDALAPSTEPGWRAVAEADAGPFLATHRVHALHDADPRGCALPLRLAAAGAVQVVDLGLRPAQLTGRHIQVIEGAPYVVPADLSALLTADEVVWLADGRRVELAILTPAELVEAVHRALVAVPVPPPGRAPAAVALGGASLVERARELREMETPPQRKVTD